MTAPCSPRHAHTHGALPASYAARSSMGRWRWSLKTVAPLRDVEADTEVVADLDIMFDARHAVGTDPIESISTSLIRRWTGIAFLPGYGYGLTRIVVDRSHLVGLGPVLQTAGGRIEGDAVEAISGGTQFVEVKPLSSGSALRLGSARPDGWSCAQLRLARPAHEMEC
jgi:hypothetical protein